MKRVLVLGLLIIACACIPQPPGVTLRQMDGGPHYWSQFTNGYPADDSLFPIAGFNWNENGQTGNTSAAWAAAGLNTVFNFYDAPNIPEVNAAGLYSIIKPDSLPVPGNPGLTKIVGYIPGDEPDGNAEVYCTHLPVWMRPYCHSGPNNRTDPSSLSIGVDQLHYLDPSRAVFSMLTKPVALGQGLYDPNRAPYLLGSTGVDCPNYCPGPDASAYDYYPATDPYENPTGGPYHHWWDQCNGVQGMRSEANYTRPIWATIITSSGQTSSWWAYDPTPSEIRAEAWTAVICGAQGLVYFKNNLDDAFAPVHPHTIDTFTDSHYATTTAAIKQTNGEIKALGKLLTPAAPYADGLVTSVSGNVNYMVKSGGVPQSGFDYLVCLVGRQNEAQTVTLNVNIPDGTPVTDELSGEHPAISGGQITVGLGPQQVRALLIG